MEKVEARLKEVLDMQNEYLNRLADVEKRLADIVARVEQTEQRQEQLEADFRRFQTRLVEQIRRFSRSSNLYH